ncbi:MAG TPA: response regulator transcription factor [Blastocatellia bacterium]|nr:response regulator transcription factor [Blastocatellia bacterium]
MKLLIADDSCLLCEKIVGLLADLNGIEIVGQVQEAQEALNAARELKPDVMTLDIQMIGGCGIDVLKQIKSQRQSPVVIMLTNRSSSPYRRRCIEAGADFFLDKSTEFGEVRKIVKGLLAVRSQ